MTETKLHVWMPIQASELEPTTGPYVPTSKPVIEIDWAQRRIEVALWHRDALSSPAVYVINGHATRIPVRRGKTKKAIRECLERYGYDIEACYAAYNIERGDNELADFGDKDELQRWVVDRIAWEMGGQE